MARVIFSVVAMSVLFALVVVSPVTVLADCLADIKSFVDSYELGVYGFQRTAPNHGHNIATVYTDITSGQANQQDPRAGDALWPNTLSARTICTQTAQWIYGELFSSYAAVVALPFGVLPNHPPPHGGVHAESITSTVFNNVVGTPFAVGRATWQRGTLWSQVPGTAFAPNVKRVVQVHINHDQNSHSHVFVIEAPAEGQLRVYQSFIQCYSFKDWMRPSTTSAFHTKEALVPLKAIAMCNPDAAHRPHGGGRLLTDGAAATFISHVQQLIDAVHGNNGVAAQWAAAPNGGLTMRAAYFAITGVDLAAPAGGTFSISLKYRETSDAVCRYNRKTVIDPLLRAYRAEFKNQNLLPRTTITYHWKLDSASMKQADDSATLMGTQNWLEAQRRVRAEQNAYWKRIQYAAGKYCDSATEYDYRYILSSKSNVVQQSIKTLANGQAAVQIRAQKPAVIKSPIDVDVTCAVNTHGPPDWPELPNDPNNGGQPGMACRMLAVQRHGHAHVAVQFRVLAESYSRYEFQFCVDKTSGDITKAQSVPYKTLL